MDECKVMCFRAQTNSNPRSPCFCPRVKQNPVCWLTRDKEGLARGMENGDGLLLMLLRWLMLAARVDCWFHRAAILPFLTR